MTDKEPETYQCTECQAGMMHLQHITYFTWLDEELVTVPNFPAWVCDLCGRREYDSRAISWLVTILNPETGKAAAAKRRPRPELKKRSGTRPSPDKRSG
jgi:YgiT-type zinc finger domain-containing protein